MTPDEEDSSEENSSEENSLSFSLPLLSLRLEVFLYIPSYSRSLLPTK